MHEIEVKARVRNRQQLEATLAEKRVVLSAPETQHDTIYIHGDWAEVQHDPERVVLRIRQLAKKSVLTLKKNGVNELHSIEHETEISSPDEMREILGLTGWQSFVEVKKSRQKAHSADMEICLDTVEGLGDFIELERLVEDGSQAEAVQVELFAFLETLGVTKEDQETRGYDTMIRQAREGN